MPSCLKGAVQQAHLCTIFPCAFNRRNPCTTKRNTCTNNDFANAKRCLADACKGTFCLFPCSFSLGCRFIQRLVCLGVVHGNLA